MTPKPKRRPKVVKMFKTAQGDPEDRIHEIADELIGTCLNITSVVTDEELDDVVLMSKLDELCFECEGCGWWCHEEELNEGTLCNDCFNEQGNDDD